MRKLDLKSGEDRELIEIIKPKTSGFNSGAVLTEIFINTNGTVFVNAITKNEKKAGSHLFVLVEGKDKELEVSSSIMGTTFIPLADSELIGLLKSSVGDFDSYRVITDIESKLCFGEKIKQITDKNNNCLIIPINYKGSCFDIFLDLNTGKIVGRINYVTDASTQINDSHNFSLAKYESEFIKTADEIFGSFEDERIKKQANLLEKVLKTSSNNKQGLEE